MLLEDMPVMAFKIGAATRAEVVSAIAEVVADYDDIPLILAPDFTLDDEHVLAADELRHAACYAKYMRRAVANKPEVLPDILKMSLWMMRSTNDAPKHPTTITEPSVGIFSPGRIRMRSFT